MRTCFRVCRAGAVGAAVAVALLACALLCACGSQARVDEASPRVANVDLATTSSMTEVSQAIRISVSFDGPISAQGDVAGDFALLINGKTPDSSVVKTDVRANANGVVVTLSPADGAAQGAGAGQFFAMYQAQFSLASSREDGALPHITGQSGSNAVIDQPIEGTLPSGLAISMDEQRAGSAAENVAAQTTFTVTSPALARVITWFSPDGGKTVLLKHNHAFAQADAQDCAADLVKVVNAQTGLGISAQAQGAQVTLTAATPVDGQVISPCIVEGVGVFGGSYDGSMGTGA